MLAYLLDENISPVIADQITVKNPQIVVHSVHRWHGGQYQGQSDTNILRAAFEEQLTLVTYDLKTIPPLLMEFAADSETHAGVLFVDEASIRSNDFGGLINDLLSHWQKYATEDWTNRIAFLVPGPA